MLILMNFQYCQVTFLGSREQIVLNPSKPDANINHII